MNIFKRDSELGTKDICLEDGNKRLSFIFGGNGDLYLVRSDKNYNFGKEHNYETFAITKANYELYNLFQILYRDIESINIFDSIELLYNVNTDEDYIDCMKEQELVKKRYRESNYSNYNELFNSENRTITWYSDETGHDVANIMQIRKNDDTFSIDFFTQPYIDGYEMEDNTSGIAVRIRNSGSLYCPFNIVFMRMFNELQEVDDIKDCGHQYHIDEYLYLNKGKVEEIVPTEKIKRLIK